MCKKEENTQCQHPERRPINGECSPKQIEICHGSKSKTECECSKHKATDE